MPQRLLYTIGALLLAAWLLLGQTDPGCATPQQPALSVEYGQR